MKSSQTVKLANSLVLAAAFSCVAVMSAKPGCVRWRQTGGCSPDGPREPGGDRGQINSSTGSLWFL